MEPYCAGAIIPSCAFWSAYLCVSKILYDVRKSRHVILHDINIVHDLHDTVFGKGTKVCTCHAVTISSYVKREVPRLYPIQGVNRSSDHRTHIDINTMGCAYRVEYVSNLDATTSTFTFTDDVRVCTGIPVGKVGGHMCMDSPVGEMIHGDISAMLEKQSGDFKQAWTKDALAYLETLPKYEDLTQDEETPHRQDDEHCIWVPFCCTNDEILKPSPLSQMEIDMFRLNINNSIVLDWEHVKLFSDDDDGDDADDDSDDVYKYTRFLLKTSEDVERNDFLGIINTRSTIEYEPANKKKKINNLGYRLRLPGHDLSVCLKTSSGIGQYILDTVPDFIDRNTCKRVEKSRVHEEEPMEDNVIVMPYIKYGDDKRSPELVLVLIAIKDMDAGTTLCARSSISISNPEARQAYLAETIINTYSDSWKIGSINLGDIDEATNSGSVDNINSGSYDSSDGSGDSSSTDSAQNNPDESPAGNQKEDFNPCNNSDSVAGFLKNKSMITRGIVLPSVKSDTGRAAGPSDMKAGATTTTGNNAHLDNMMGDEKAKKRKRDAGTFGDDGPDEIAHTDNHRGANECGAVDATRGSKRSKKPSERPTLSDMFELLGDRRANDIYTEVREKALADAATDIDELKVSLTNQKRTLSRALNQLRKIVQHRVDVADGKAAEPAKELNTMCKRLSAVVNFIDGDSRKKTKKTKTLNE